MACDLALNNADRRNSGNGWTTQSRAKLLWQSALMWPAPAGSIIGVAAIA
jgi:hypothetical protein